MKVLLPLKALSLSYYIMSVVSFLTRASVYIKNAVKRIPLKNQSNFFDVLHILSTEITLSYPIPKMINYLNHSENHVFKQGSHAFHLTRYLY